MLATYLAISSAYKFHSFNSSKSFLFFIPNFVFSSQTARLLTINSSEKEIVKWLGNFYSKFFTSSPWRHDDALPQKKKDDGDGVKKKKRETHGTHNDSTVKFLSSPRHCY